MATSEPVYLDQTTAEYRNYSGGTKQQRNASRSRGGGYDRPPLRGNDGRPSSRGESLRPNTAPDTMPMQDARASMDRSYPLRLPPNMMDVVVLRREHDQYGGVNLQSTAGSFSGLGQSGVSTDNSMVASLREGPLVSIGMSGDVMRPSTSSGRTSLPGPGSSETALKNKLAHSRQMLQEARRRIQVLELSRKKDVERAEHQISLQVEAVRSEAMVEIRKLKERAKMHEGTRSSVYIASGNGLFPGAGGPTESSATPGGGRDPEEAHATSARELVLQVELQQLQSKSKRDKNDLAKKLEQAYLDLRLVKDERTEMAGGVSELKSQLAHAHMATSTWKLAAAGKERMKRDRCARTPYWFCTPISVMHDLFVIGSGRAGKRSKTRSKSLRL